MKIKITLPIEIKQAAPNQKCFCRCGTKVTNFFRPGHDSKAMKRFTDQFQGKQDKSSTTANFLLAFGYVDEEAKWIGGGRIDEEGEWIKSN